MFEGGIINGEGEDGRGGGCGVRAEVDAGQVVSLMTMTTRHRLTLGDPFKR